MSSSLVVAALTELRALLWSAQVAVVRAGAVTWTGAAAEAADARRTDLLRALRTCLDAVEHADRLAQAARRAEQLCVAGRPLDAGVQVPRWG